MDVKSELQNLENLASRDRDAMLDLELLEEFLNLVMGPSQTRGHRKKYLQALFLYWKMKTLMGRILMET